VRYLYIKRNVKNVWGARYTLGAHYLLKNTVNECTWRLFLSIYVKVMKGTKDDWCSVVAEVIMAIRKGGNMANDNFCEILTKF
jgi:hypothetical protein